MNRRRDILSGLLLLLLGAGYYAVASGFRRTFLSDRVGAGGFPKLLAASLILLSLVMVVRAVLHPKADDAEVARRRQLWCRDRQYFTSAAGLLALGILYLIVVPWAGYAPAIGLFLLAVLLYQRERLGARAAVFSLAGAGLFWFFFVYAMRIHMPRGIWPAVIRWVR